MTFSPEKYIQRLNECLVNKYKILNDIMALTSKQSLLIKEECIEELEKYVDAKQQKIDLIDKIDDEFEVYFQRLKQVLGINNLEEVKQNFDGLEELKLNANDVLKLINSIKEIELVNNKNAQSFLNEIGQEIKKMNIGKKVNHAYIPDITLENRTRIFDSKK